MPHTRKGSKQEGEAPDALDLHKGLFQGTPEEVGRALRRSAVRSRRKTDPFRSAMSMLNFYINRAGRQLSSTRKNQLEAAKDVLRELFHRPSPRTHTHRRSP